MRRILAVLLRQPLLLVGGSLALLWVVYVGAALRPRLGLTPMDTSCGVLLSRGNTTTLVQTAPDGQARSVEKIIGPVAPWKNGLVYWDNTKPCLVITAPGAKPKTVWLHPSFPKLDVESTLPAPDGVYLNVDGKRGFSVLHVRLPDGAARIVPHIEEVKSGEATTNYAVRTIKKGKSVVIVRYANQKTRTVPVSNSNYSESWDYDPVRDAVIWMEDDMVCYDSPSRSWRKKLSGLYTVAVNHATGDVWVQTRGSFSSKGMAALTAAGGIERGWRWRGEIF